LTRELTEIKELVGDIEKIRKERDQALQDAKKSSEDLKNDKQTQKNITDKLNKEIEQLKTKAAEANKALKQSSEINESAKSQSNDLKTQLEKAQKESTSFASQVGELKKDQESLQQKLSEAQKQSTSVEQKLSERSTKVEELTVQLQNAQKEAQSFKNKQSTDTEQSGQHQNKINDLESQIKTLLEERETNGQQLMQHADRIRSLEEQLLEADTLRTQLAQLAQARDEDAKIVEKSEQEIVRLLARANDLELQVQDAQRQTEQSAEKSQDQDALQQRIQQLESEKASLQSDLQNQSNKYEELKTSSDKQAEELRIVAAQIENERVENKANVERLQNIELSFENVKKESQVEIENLQLRIKELEVAATVFELGKKEIETHQSRIQQLELLNKETETANQQVLAETKQRYGAEIAELSRQIKQFEQTHATDVSTFHSRINELQQQHQQELEASKQEGKVAADRLTERLHQLEAQLQQAGSQEKNIEALQQQLDRVQHSNAELKSERDSFEERARMAAEDLAQWKLHLQQEHDKYAQESAAKTSQIEKLDFEVQRLTQELVKSTEETQRIQELEGLVASLTNDLTRQQEAREQEKQQFLEQVQTLQTTLHESQQNVSAQNMEQLQHAAQQIDQIKEQLRTKDALLNTQTQQLLSVQAVLEQKASESESFKLQLSSKNDQVNKLWSEHNQLVQAHETLLKQFKEVQSQRQQPLGIEPEPTLPPSSPTSRKPVSSPTHLNVVKSERRASLSSPMKTSVFLSDELDELIDALEDNIPSFKVLDFANVARPLNQLHEDQIADFADMFAENKTVEAASFSGKGFDSKIANVVLHQLQKNSVLTELDLSNNQQLDDKALNVLTNLLDKNKSIKKLNLSQTGLSADAIAAVREHGSNVELSV
jgi:chromosome segregation ATPase